MTRIMLGAKIGPGQGAQGAESDLRLTNDLGLVVQQLHGRLFEAAIRQKLFYAATSTAGVAPGTAINTTPPLALYNPDGSGVLLAVLKTWMGMKSGTLGVGTLFYTNTTAKGAAPGTGAVLTPKSAYLGASLGQGQAFQGSTLASTPTILRPALTITPIVDSTAAAPWYWEDNVDGSIIVPPGYAVALQEVGAAGSSPLVQFGILWEEVPIPT
jgi:hypothetical protein